MNVLEAVKTGDVDRLLYLLQQGVNAQYQRGRTALMEACIHDRIDAAHILLQHGANTGIHVRDDRGESAMTLACWGGDLPLVRLLQEHGASIYDRDPAGATTMSRAIRKHEPRLVRHIIESVEEDVENKGKTRQEAMDFINSQDEDGETALSTACLCQRFGIVPYLLDHGASEGINLHSHEYLQTALHLVSMAGDVDTVRLLLEAGADPTLVDVRGMTARDMAAESGYQAVVDVLDEYEKWYTMKRLRILPQLDADPDLYNKFRPRLPPADPVNAGHDVDGLPLAPLRYEFQPGLDPKKQALVDEILSRRLKYDPMVMLEKLSKVSGV